MFKPDPSASFRYKTMEIKRDEVAYAFLFKKKLQIKLRNYIYLIYNSLIWRMFCQHLRIGNSLSLRIYIISYLYVSGKYIKVDCKLWSCYRVVRRFFENCIFWIVDYSNIFWSPWAACCSLNFWIVVLVQSY